MPSIPPLPWHELYDLSEALTELMDDGGWTDDLGAPPPLNDPGLPAYLRRAAAVVRDDPEQADDPRDEAYAETLERLARMLENQRSFRTEQITYAT